MHEFRQFIEAEMNRLGMTRQADLIRASGLGRTHVSKLLNDSRDRLGRMPDPETIIGLAKAFNTTPEHVARVAASALDRTDVDEPLLVPTVRGVPTVELIRELSDRVAKSADGLQLLDIDAIADPKAGPELLAFHDQLIRDARKDRAAGSAGLAEGKEWLAAVLNRAFAQSVANRRQRNPGEAASQGRRGRR